MKKIFIITIVLFLFGGCSTSKEVEPEICDLSEYKQFIDEMAFIVGKLREKIHILGTQTSPDYLLIKSETIDLLEIAKNIQAPTCLEKSKGLLISTIESAIVGIKLFEAGESEKAINHINENTNEILNQYIQEIITVMYDDKGK